MKLLISVFFLLLNLVVKAQKAHVVLTDSSRIETRIYSSGKEVKEFITSKDRVYYQFHRDNRPHVTTASIYTKTGRAIGITKEFDDEGKLLYSIDHDRGLWNVVNARIDPYYTLRQQTKAKADRLIAAMYGQYFLINNVVWNVQESYIYTSVTSGNWTEYLGGMPVRFLFRYNVKLDQEHVHPELIEFALDSQGNYIADDYEEIYGFERLSAFPTDGFGLTYRKALATVKRKIREKDVLQAGFLKWEKEKNPFIYSYGLYTGRFRFYVPVRTGVRKDIHPKGRSRITTYYDVYSFDPWSGDYVGKQLMESVREWEERSGFSSGLRYRR